MIGPSPWWSKSGKGLLSTKPTPSSLNDCFVRFAGGKNFSGLLYAGYLCENC